MGLKKRVIDVFEDRVKGLVQIRDIIELPQWTETDVIAADCLLREYRKLTCKSTDPDRSWACPNCGAVHDPIDEHYLYCCFCGKGRF